MRRTGYFTQKNTFFLYIDTFVVHLNIFVQNEQQCASPYKMNPKSKVKRVGGYGGCVCMYVCMYGQKEKDTHFKFGCSRNTPYTHFDFLHLQIFRWYKYKWKLFVEFSPFLDFVLIIYRSLPVKLARKQSEVRNWFKSELKYNFFVQKG